MAKPTAKTYPLADVAAKAPTELHNHFSQWVIDQTGYTPENRADFDAGIRFGTILRGAHQVSPENVERRNAERKRNNDAREEARKASMVKKDKPAAEKPVKAASKAEKPSSAAKKSTAAAPEKTTKPARRSTGVGRGAEAAF